jgi:hypothetical protein
VECSDPCVLWTFEVEFIPSDVAIDPTQNLLVMLELSVASDIFPPLVHRTQTIILQPPGSRSISSCSKSSFTILEASFSLGVNDLLQRHAFQQLWEYASM